MQVINTSGYGNLTFVRTWADSGIHIGKLAGGGYCHIGGPAISSKRELETAIPGGKYLDEALDWWENKDRVEVKKDKPKVMLMDDGSYALSDGSQIKSVGDLISLIPPGPALDAAVLWYVETHKDKIKAKVAEREETEHKTEETKEELAKRTCTCGMIAKSFAGLTVHQRTCKVYQAQEQKVT